MTENCRRFGTPGIEAIIGDFLSVDLSALEAPDAIFIGGHGGKLVEILMVVSKKMKENGVIVFNSVSDESKALLEEAVRQTGLRISAQTRITIDDFNTITVNVIYQLFQYPIAAGGLLSEFLLLIPRRRYYHSALSQKRFFTNPVVWYLLERWEFAYAVSLPSRKINIPIRPWFV